MKIPFWKVESIGNNFVLVHLDDVSLLGENGRESELLTVLAVAACEKRYGIGSDGLLAVSQDGDGTLILRMFNPDGTEDFCGNGIRCAFDHALRQGWLAPGEMRMTHFGIPVSGSAQHLADHAKGSLSAIRHAMHRTPYLIHTQLPPASYRPEDIPIAREREIFDSAIARVDGEVYTGSVLSTGTAHTILPVRTLPHDEEFFRVSPQIERDPLFPERTSVMWVHELDDDKIQLRVWERGVGETSGCGSGSTAAAVDYLRRNGRGGSVMVWNPGGFVTVTAASWEAPPRISGVAAELFTGEFPFPAKKA